MRAVAVRHWHAALARAATWTGHGVRSVPGAGGALLVSYGAWQIYAPAGAIAAGAFLLALDRVIR